jgi:putative adenylate-forming enzyme
MRPGVLTRLLKERRRLRKRDRWTRRELEIYQTGALRELRDFAHAHSRFYQRFHVGLENRPLHELPVLTKAELMASFDELVTDPEVRLAGVQSYAEHASAASPFLGRYLVAQTSGSTGLRGVFLANMEEWMTVLASYARANDWAGVKAGLMRRMKLAVVSSRMPWHQSALVGATLESRIVKTLRLDAADPLDSIVARLNEFQPDALVAYASMAGLLADEQRQARLRIEPSGIMCASEVLTDDVRRRIHEAWRIESFNVYAATETAGVASECDRHSGLHLYEDLVIAEVVDEANRPVPPGVQGAKVLVTVLFSRTQPLIRYEMSDRLTLSGKACACGRPFAMLEAISGRAEDVLIFARTGGGTISVHPVVVHQALDGVRAAAWQVIREDDRALRVLIAGAYPDFEERPLTDALSRALAKLGADEVRIEIAKVAAIPRTALGKAPLIKRA